MKKIEFSSSDAWENNNYLDTNTLEQRLTYISKLSVKCKHCGHTVFPKKERTICTYCGRWVYRTEKIEFKYKTLENIKNSKKK